ncbi:MAG: competence protein ComK [Exiguobacterium sp.]|nr:competence protein ComK [Exiguobacterium sp.]MBR3063672.1 competence protein ComK [Exiguobacterium sp.]MBR3215356.1 competence protein ComK [Exiguobacterium sp.]MBR3320769.1 competence protein ComK [Exiguobacterium sp.]
MRSYYSEEKYRITKRTVAILPCFDIMKQSRIILEDGTEISTPLRPYQLLQLSCRQYNSSIEERIFIAKRVAGVKGKVPVVIEPTSGLVFFPTKSPKRDDCEWYAWSHIRDILNIEGEPNGLVLTTDGHQIQTNATPYVLRNQLKATGELVARFQQLNASPVLES